MGNVGKMGKRRRWVPMGSNGLIWVLMNRRYQQKNHQNPL